MFKSVNKILIISSHADDMEFGCGATVAKLVEEGKEIFNLTLSLNSKGIDAKYTKEDLKNEAYQSADILGLKKENVILGHFENRLFPQYRQEILDYLCSYGQSIKPDLVIAPSLGDMHQDHITVAHESFRAFKYKNILSYSLDWNKLQSQTNFYNVLQLRHVDKKIQALKCYQSQLRNRAYFNPEYIKSVAITRGTEINCSYAEMFEVVRIINS